jgi:hypothetical protein
VAHQLQALLNLGVGDEGALALATIDTLFDLELSEGLANGGARNGVGLAEFALRWHGRPGGETFDYDHQGVMDTLVFGGGDRTYEHGLWFIAHLSSKAVVTSVGGFL